MNKDEIRLRCDGKTQSRTGKIARLPYKIREEVNRRLRDNVPGGKICKWLNRLPAARAVCAEFARRNGKEASPINEKQLSEWRCGGFQDWLRHAADAGGYARDDAVVDETGPECGGELSEGAVVLLSGQLLKLLQGMAGESSIRLRLLRRDKSFQVPSSKMEWMMPLSPVRRGTVRS